MKHLLRTLFIALLCTAGAAAQQITSLGLAADAASFRYDDFTSYVEVYYAFSRSGVTFKKSETGYLGNVSMNAVVKPADGDGEPIAKAWNVPVFVKDTAAMPDLRMIGRVNNILDPGKYTVFIAARDAVNPAVSDTMTLRFEVRRFKASETAFSDIQFASSIKQIEKDTSNIFYKNTLEVVPNPSGLYGKQLPVVFYYSELYGVRFDTYKLRYEVVSSYGKTLLKKTYNKTGPSEAAVEVGAVNIMALPSGVYRLNLICTDSESEVRTAQSGQFFVYNPDVPVDSTAIRNTFGLIAQEFAMLTEEELDERFNQAIYISEKEERETWDQLTGSEAKKKFLTRFWSQRDPDKTTTVNEFYMDYQSRIAYTNAEFRSAYKAGWKSDRGRVFILYGAPDAVERNSSGMDTEPYEIWYYDGIEGGIEFVFVDRRNMGLYDLVHSTKEGELSNPNYEYLIR